MIILIICPTITGNIITAQNKSYLISNATTVVDGAAAPFNQLKPGDTLLIQAGIRNSLTIRNIKGSSEKPVIITNSGGIVEVNTIGYYAFSIQYCNYFRFTGTGAPASQYGIKITLVASGAGIGIGYMSSDFEIDHISIENTLYAGIYAKTDPDCTLRSARGTFIQYNSVLHDNYFENTGNEGLYLGSSNYLGQTINCNGKDTIILPSILNGVRVYNNIIKYSGWDGIQVSSASSDCKIFNNTILYDSQAEVGGQMSGILIGGGSKCDCYNNFIGEGKGDGIEIHGLGGQRIFNNIIVDAGLTFKPQDLTQMKHGMFVSDVSVIQDSSFNILFNNIINPKSDGIRFQSIKSRNNMVVSNLIVNPGNFDYYQNGNTKFKGKDSYLMLPSSSSEVNFQNNFLTRVIDSALISSTDYSILRGSPLINGAYPKAFGVNFDFKFKPRPIGNACDIGANEFDPSTVGVETRTADSAPYCFVYPNPVTKTLTMKYLLSGTGRTTINIFNQQGNLIVKKENEYISGDNQSYQLDTAFMQQGLYLYTIGNGKELLSGKFLKLK